MKDVIRQLTWQTSDFHINYEVQTLMRPVNKPQNSIVLEFQKYNENGFKNTFAFNTLTNGAIICQRYLIKIELFTNKKYKLEIRIRIFIFNLIYKNYLHKI